MTRKYYNRQQGSALLITVLILTGIITVALNAANVVMTGTVLSGVQERSTLALYAAESGAERFLYDARRVDPSTLPSISTINLYGTTTLSNNASYVVDYGTSTASISASSTGIFMETKRMVGLIF